MHTSFGLVLPSHTMVVGSLAFSASIKPTARSNLEDPLACATEQRGPEAVRFQREAEAGAQS